MEYIQSKPNNIDVYVNEFHTRIKTEFEKSINKIYNEELSVYRQVIETVVKLPFIQEIIEENKTLKAKLKVLEEADNVVKLEIFDKPVSKTLLDVETIPFSSESNSDANSDTNSDDDDADDESSGDSSEDDDDDKPIVITTDKEEPTKPSADKESEEEQSADEDVEPSADEEDQSPTFPVKIIVNKLDKEEDNLEEVEEESSEDQEVETETEEVEESEEEPSADNEGDEEPSADNEGDEEPSADAEVIEIEIDGKTYYCESEENGNIYEDDNGEVGNIVGEIKDGEASFFE